MDPLDTLQTLSEIAIAVTGFAGVVSVLGPHTREDWSEQEIWNLRLMLYWSLATVFLAYVPTILIGLGEHVSQPWRISHAIFATYHSYVFYRAFQGMHRRPEWRDRPTLFLTFVGLMVLALEVASAFGFTGALAPTFYVIAVLWFLVLSVTRFVVLVTTGLEPTA